ncbi:MAG: dethiobiotin synthase [Acidobacteriota bacterium]|nr:dethiobiotin synthase [Acidobacteriota bacterium]
MKSSFFVTGTDTSVGKTVLSALLTAALGAVYWKPVQSGAIEGTDRQTVMRIAGIPEQRTRPECYCFDPPVSPHLAAREAGIRIDLSRIRIPEIDEDLPLVVEGAGGILTPLNETETLLNLISHLSLPVVVAARSSLGTINHSLLTLGALRQANAEVRGVVMLGEENLENRRAIEHYGEVPVIGHVPWLANLCRGELIQAFETRFDQAAFRPRSST